MFDVNELGSTDRRIFWIACWCFTAKGRTTVPLNKLLLWDQSLNVGDICNSLTSSPLKIFFYQQAKSQPVLQTQINFRKFISPVAPLPLFAAHRGSNSLLPCGKNLYRATEFSARGLARTLWFQSPIKVAKIYQRYSLPKKRHLPATLVNVHVGYLIWTEGHYQLPLPGKQLVEDNFVGAALVTVVQPEKCFWSRKLFGLLAQYYW